VGNFSYKLYRLFLSLHSFSVTFFTLGSRLFFYSAANKLELDPRGKLDPRVFLDFYG
jgi:hypothetical protein